MQAGVNAIMDTIAKRAAAARKFAEMTQKEAEAASGVRQSDISKIERGDTERPVGLLALARAYGVDPNWLDTGDGQMSAGQSRQPTNTEPGPDVRGLVPLISWVQAGNWSEAQDPLQPGDAERWLPCPVTHSPGTFVLRVRGDSMTAPHGNSRTYPEGALVFVDPERRNPTNGDRIIAKLEGEDEVTFKVYKNEDGRQWLHALNPAHEPIRQSFRVLGTVIGMWTD